ncbi:MAG: polysaccharide biosynthesis/export family protein [Steroidobacteraceae bacterium]|nr:polysaccharide biosynthesis/export family protein [Steroidobacteraceae bacterium]
MFPTTRYFDSVAGRRLVTLFIAWACLLFASCAQSVRADSTKPSKDAPQLDDAAEYLIGPGDTLQVFVWRNPELSTTVPVRPDGKISTPLVENMTAVGKTPTELARDMEQVLSEYVRSPKVNIIVTAPASTLSQVRVIGQVTKPKGIPYREGMTVLDVVLEVGGLSQFAAGNRAKVVRQDRNNPRTTKEIPVRLSDLLNKGDMRQNIVMQPGDVLVVPQSRF